jgi:hypothetical protein
MSSFEFAFFAILGTFTIFFPISLGQSSLAEIQPKAYQLPLPPALEGPLAVNNLLQNLTKLLENQINAPESLLVENGNTIYTGTGDGKVVKIVDGVIQKEVNYLIIFFISHSQKALNWKEIRASESIISFNLTNLLPLNSNGIRIIIGKN